MKSFAKFFRTQADRFENGKFVECAPYNVEACGSDSIMHLDARNTRKNRIAAAKKHMDSLNKNLNKGYTGFEIHNGTIGYSRVIYNSFEADRNAWNSQFLNSYKQ